ncbi:DUF6065 family protein [Caulobacter sp. 17J65-9]|uniref:DUF6065 family protein n=1 Tax=Caulobacter sp. 17J65-9 TaxID=2709382 RepID=UPI0013CCF732|nr:DUF6065 family protein [Caulobacter sp. 17J65-9]NEX94372.1 hypothetical protein [Caulobacter sp. 17J65-9]
MELECYPMGPRPPELVPGRPNRDWMDAFASRHPYRCLPLTMANTTGWEMLCPMSFTAEWNGGPTQNDITLTPERLHPDFAHFAQSHFAGGVLTLHPGYMFRTPPGWQVWCGGSPNQVKDGIQPLSGLIETDWLPFPFTMNWKFTRPGRVKFQKGEAFCFITLVQHQKIEQFEPVMKVMERDPVLQGQFEAWNRQRTEFNKRLANGDPDTVKEAWQRFYFKGELPEDTGPAPAGHVNKRRLKPVRMF